MLTKNNTQNSGTEILSLVSVILMAFNIINVFLSKERLIYNWRWYGESDIYLLTLIKCGLYLLVPIVLFLSIKLNKKCMLLFSSISLLLANICMLFFRDVSNYIFSFVIGTLGIISTVFLIISSIFIIGKSKSSSIHIVSCFFNTVIISFTFVMFTVIIPEGIEWIVEYIVEYIEQGAFELSLFTLGDGFYFLYYLLQSLYFILLLNAINLLLFDCCESTELYRDYIGKGYTNIAKHILLPFCTLGIYTVIWIYKITKASSNNSKSKAIEAVILNVFIPFYGIYWYYKISKNIEDIFERKGRKNQGFSTLIIVLSIFLPFIAYIVLQSKMNEALTTRVVQIPNQNYQRKPVVIEQKKMNYLDEIKSLKELLDVGAITQEEFEIKKKELLRL